MNKARGGSSRRRFLTGAAGAATGGLLAAMTGAGPIGAAEPWTGPLRLAEEPGTALVLGAGIAGLAAAYELRKAGFQVEILEAQQRPGGRSLTARPGSVVTERAADGSETSQTCGFDEGQYLNLGPGRLPYHHRRILRYCHELGVALEPYVMETSANLVCTHGFPGAQLNRRVTHDTRGHLAALLSKAVERGALDAELGKTHRTKLLSLLAAYGDLPRDANGVPTATDYRGSTRAGYLLADVQDVPKPTAPLALRTLLDSDYWRTSFHLPQEHLWQSSMFQPIGGMDKIVEGFTRALGEMGVPITYGAVVTAVDVNPPAIDAPAVGVTWTVGGAENSRQVDYCLSNIPLSVLRESVTANFSADFDAAVRTPRFAAACKVGWQANKRFWEHDGAHIYGGISWVDHLATQIWYPSYGYFTEKGTLTGTYNSYERAAALGELPLDKRLESAREAGRMLHKEFDDDAIVPNALGMSIAWHKVPYAMGGWADWTDSSAHRVAYGRLLSPDGRFFVIGDQVSPLPGWQEGAVMSAQYVTGQVLGTESREVPEVSSAPDARALTTGTL